MVTKGQRRIGRTIRKLGNSVEFSTKENKAKESEKKYRERIQKLSGCTDDSPIQSLRDPFTRKKTTKNPELLRQKFFNKFTQYSSTSKKKSECGRNRQFSLD
jgi:hypothetical protein